ncbi:MAG TPA: metallophosphoesterase family protein [Chitinophagaceae bacterium]
MRKIALISDTHGFVDPAIFPHLAGCDEIWHAGDFGNMAVAEELQQRSGLPLKGVYGNIDGQDVRAVYPEILRFTCEQVNVFIKHIGGYPNRYAPGVRQQLLEAKAGLFISGHSHILKIIYEGKLGCLHMNPGAAGRQGWHLKRTLIRFIIDGAKITNCEVVELGSRGG